jgi:hypothetical protein
MAMLLAGLAHAIMKRVCCRHPENADTRVKDDLGLIDNTPTIEMMEEIAHG